MEKKKAYELNGLAENRLYSINGKDAFSMDHLQEFRSVSISGHGKAFGGDAMPCLRGLYKAQRPASIRVFAGKREIKKGSR